ncbi:Ig-like domain-containing protein [Pontiellaceae bacterium B12219]|nr:Ig-like domain-containing protein [Pontiellaceae bacterium B12219]
MKHALKKEKLVWVNGNKLFFLLIVVGCLLIPVKANAIEAESMTLNGFSVEAQSTASGGQVIVLNGDSGSATMTVGVSGTYDIETIYFDENDGAAVYKVYVNNVLLDAWEARRDLDSADPVSTNLVSHYTKAVSLISGQTLELLSYSNNGEPCRVDQVVLTESSSGSSVHTMTWTTNATLSSLILNNVDYLGTGIGTAQIRTYEGFSMDTSTMAEASERSGVAEVVNGDQKMVFRIDEFEHHLLFRLIGFEGIDRYDETISARVTIPVSGPVGLLMLDDWAEATVSNSELEINWYKLVERNRFPGGMFALFSSGTAVERQVVLNEIEALHGGGLDLSFNQVPEAFAGSAYIVEGSSGEITLNGLDPDADSLSYEVVLQPENGTLTGSGKTLIYTPDIGFSGNDLLAFVVSDGVAESVPAAVKISVVPVEGAAVAHWPLNDENGSVVRDVSATGADGTLSGGTWVSGHDGGALEFSGSESSDSVRVPSSAFASVNDEISIAMWVNGDAVLQPRKDSLFYAEDTGGSRLLNIHLPWDSETVYWDAGSSSGYDRIEKPASAADYKGQWNHWIFTKDASVGTMKIFLNGALWQSGTGKNEPIGAVDDACFGSGLGDNYYEGSLDDVRIYNYALDDAAVSSLYSGYADWVPVAYNRLIHVGEGSSKSFALSAVDPEGDDLNYTVLSQPMNGVLSGSGTNMTYVPDAGYIGSDSFTFSVDDGIYSSEVATVSILVDAKPIAYDFTETVNEDESLVITLSGVDPEGSNLTYYVESLPVNGSLSGDAPSLTYVPDADYFGSDSFTYTVSDGVSFSAVATVWITVNAVNDEPVAHDQSTKVKVNGSVFITLSAFDIDQPSLGYTVLAGPSSGTLSGTEPYLTYTPNADFIGSDSFTFVVTDGNSETDPATVSIDVVEAGDWITWNAAEDITGDTDVSISGSSVWAYSFGAFGSYVINGVTFTGDATPNGNADVAINLGQAYTGYGNSSGTFGTLSTAYQGVLTSGAYDGGSSTAITLNDLKLGSEYELQFWINDSRNRSDMDSKPRSATIAGTSNVVDYNTAGASTSDGLGQYIIGTFIADATTQTIELDTIVPQLNAMQLRVLSGTDSCLDTYSVWIASYGLSGEESLYNADTDGDGYNAYVEFALGMDPSVRDAESAVSYAMIDDVGTSYFEFVHKRRSDYLDLGLSYHLINSTNLMDSTQNTNAQDQILIGGSVEDYESVTNRYLMVDPAMFLKLDIQSDL